MQPTRIFIRSPQVTRIAKTPCAARTMSLFTQPQFLPRFHVPAVTNELAPFFRLLEDITTDTSRVFDHFSATSTRRSFQPRFDLRENGPNYELRGELPGVDGKDVEVEFTDAQTLVIRGRTESEVTSGSPPASEAAQAIESARLTTTTIADTVAQTEMSDAASTHSAPYQAPTVEDEAGATISAASTPGPATPADSTSSEAPQQTVQTTATPNVESAQAQANHARYWVSERSTGSFQRVFNFPSRINQEGVTASLRNGVLSIVVPKAVAPGSRRIIVE